MERKRRARSTKRKKKGQRDSRFGYTNSIVLARAVIGAFQASSAVSSDKPKQALTGARLNITLAVARALLRALAVLTLLPYVALVTRTLVV